MFEEEDVIPDSQPEVESPKLLHNLRLIHSQSPTIARLRMPEVARGTPAILKKQSADDVNPSVDSDETVMSDAGQQNDSTNDDALPLDFRGMCQDPCSFSVPKTYAGDRSSVSPIGSRKRKTRETSRKRRYNVIASQPTQVARKMCSPMPDTSSEDDLDDSKREEEISFRFSQVTGRDFANDDDRKHERAMGLLNRIEAEQATLKKSLQKKDQLLSDELKGQLDELDQSLDLMLAVYRSEKEELNQCSQACRTEREQKRLLRDRQILFCRRQKRLDDAIRTQRELRELCSATVSSTTSRHKSMAVAVSVIESGASGNVSPISQLRWHYGLSPCPFRYWTGEGVSSTPQASDPGKSIVRNSPDWLSKTSLKKKGLVQNVMPPVRSRKSHLRTSGVECQTNQLIPVHDESRLKKQALPLSDKQRECDLCSPFEQLDIQTSGCCNITTQVVGKQMDSSTVNPTLQPAANVHPNDMSPKMLGNSDQRGFTAGVPDFARDYSMDDLLRKAEVVLINDSEIDTSKEMDKLFQQLGVEEVPASLLRKLLDM